MGKFIFALIVVTIFTLSSNLASGLPSASLKSNPRLVRTGTTFQLILTISYEPEFTISEPEFPKVEGLTLKNIRNERKNRMIISVAEYSADKAGTYLLGPVRIKYSSKSQDEGEINSNALEVKVFENLPRPPSMLIFLKPIPLWIYILIILLLACLLAFIAWKVAQKQTPLPESEQTIISTPDPNSPEQIAIQAVNFLARPAENDPAAVKEYFQKVHDILRQYLEDRYNVSVKMATAWEIRQELIKTQKYDHRAKAILIILNDCDWVKFAKSKPNQGEIEAIPSRVFSSLMGTGKAE